MKSLTEIYHQLREQVLPNTQTKGNANQSSARGGTMSVATGAVPSVPKEKQAAHISGNFRAGQAAIKANPSSTPTSKAIPSAGRPVISSQAKERAETIVKARNSGSPEQGSTRAREGSAERGHAAGSKFTQGAKANAQVAATAAKKAETRERIAAAHKEARRQTGSAIAADRRKKGERVLNSPPGVREKDVPAVKAKSDEILKNAKNPSPQTVTRGAKTVSNFKKGETSAPAKNTAQAATPPAKPAEKEMTFGQAFAAARKKAGGGGGVFTYKGKKYQTNVKGEKYLKQSKLKSVDEAVDHKELYKKIRGILAESDEHLDHESLGAKNKSKKSIFKATLGALEKRKWSANQDRTPKSYVAGKALVAEKNTDTGETEDEITISPKEKGKANNTINTGSTSTQNQ